MRYHSHLNTAQKIILSFNGSMPLADFLKQFFAKEKKYGSNDRKQIAALCYYYFRLGKAGKAFAPEERILTAVFLCENSPGEMLAALRPDLAAAINTTLEEKISFLNSRLPEGVSSISLDQLFPFQQELSGGIDARAFSQSFLVQPDLFLRVRPGKQAIVMEKLKTAGQDFKLAGESAIALPNSAKLKTILEPDVETVIQDYSSQQVLDYVLQSGIAGMGTNLQTWDCCAASGGKSILLYDLLNGAVQLTVSDIRPSILTNLAERFERAGIKNYQSVVADLSNPETSVEPNKYALIICDAPCTGSGTWSRTPEQLFHFKKTAIEHYTNLQQKIVSKAIPALKPNGLFVYITCSVFQKENEGMVDFIKEKFHLNLLQMELLKGYDKKADSMFVAVFSSEGGKDFGR